MRLFVGIFVLFVLCLKEAYSQYYGCCTAPYYQTPGVCCSHPCCHQTMAPVICCGQKEVLKIMLTLKTYEVWKDDYSKPSSGAYISFKDKFINAIKKAYEKSKLKNVAVTVNNLQKGSTVVTFVLTFDRIYPDPLLQLRTAIGTGWIPQPLDSEKIRVYPMSMTVKDSVINPERKVNLDCKPIVNQQNDEEMENEILEIINNFRPIHEDDKLQRTKMKEINAKTWSTSLAGKQKLQYTTKNDKDRSENYYMGCVKEGEYLTGGYIAKKWYDEVKIYFGKGTLLDKLKKSVRFINLIYKGTTKVDIGVSRFKKGTSTCFIAVAFFTPKALTKTPKQLVANIKRGKYTGSRKRHEIIKPKEQFQFEQVM